MNDLIELALAVDNPRFAAEERAANPPPAKPYTVKSWDQMMTMPLPPRVTYLGEVFALAQIQAMMGQGGVGKSRVSVNISRNQVLGLPFGGLETHREPLRWLFIGNENSIYRLQYDLKRMSEGLNRQQLKRLGEFIHLHALENVDDSFICLADPQARDKYLSTLEQVRPQVLVVDPWGEIQFGDPNNDLDTRASIRELVKVCRTVDPTMALQILHHARTGRQNIRQAEGWDKGNFGKGSKALYSGARAVINLAPADPDDHSKIVMVCGKTNDSKPFETRGLILDDRTMTYDVDPSFDLEAWQNDVDGKLTGGKAVLSIRDVVEHCQSPIEKGELVDALMKASGCSKSAAYNWIPRAEKVGAISMRGKYYKTTGKFNAPTEVQSADDEAIV